MSGGMMRLGLGVLGSSCCIPRAARACAGYVIESRTTRLACDFGMGSFGRLQALGGASSLDAIVISHMHADHFLDLITLRYALRYGVRPASSRLPLWLPPGGEPILRKIASSFIPENDDFLDAVFAVRTFDSEAVLGIGDLTLRFTPTTHYIPCYAIRVEADGASLTYSADTGYDERVVALASDCDLFLCEATLSAHADAADRIGHATAADAGRMAREARVARLVLTHWSGETTAAELCRQAQTQFSGPVAVADDGDRFKI